MILSAIVLPMFCQFPLPPAPPSKIIKTRSALGSLGVFEYNADLNVTKVGDTENWSKGQTATQSSTYHSKDAARAADGNRNGDYYGGSVSHTDLDTEAWWHVDLGQVRPIIEIRLFNRTDSTAEVQGRLKDFYVFVSDVPFTPTTVAATLVQSGVSAFYRPCIAGELAIFNINRDGRYVRVQLTGTDYLHIAEVEVCGLSRSADRTYDTALRLFEEYDFRGDNKAKCRLSK